MVLAAASPFETPAVIGVLAAMGIALVIVLVRELRNVPAKLLVLMATAFLDMVGLFFIVPIMPFYVKTLGAGATVFGHAIGEGLLTGLVASAFTVAQLISAPWWGRCSDRWGRRPVLLVALFASAAAFLLFGFAESLWLLLLSRIVQGAGGGTVGVIQAYVADAVEPEQRARGLGWLSAATNLGVAFGPVLGTGAVWLGDHDLLPGAATLQLGRAAPGVFAALLCLLNMLFAWRYLREPVVKSHAPVQRATPLAAARIVLAQPRAPASRLLLVYAVTIGVSQGINQTLVLLVGVHFGVDEKSIGPLFMYIGTLSVFARVLVLGRAVDRFGEARVAPLGILSLACGLAVMPFATTLGTLALAAALLPLGAALTFPCVTSLLSRIVPTTERGLYMGLQQTFGGITRLIAPPAFGYAYDEISHGAPFWLGAGVVLVTLTMSTGLARGSVPPPAR